MIRPHTPSDHEEAQAAAHLFPFAVNALGRDGGVGVCSTQLDAVALGDLLHFGLDGLDGLPLLVGLCQSGLELLVSCDQTLKEEKTRLVLPQTDRICDKQQPDARHSLYFSLYLF